MVSSIFSREPDLQQVFQLIGGFHLIAHFFHLPAFLSVQYIPTPRKHLRCVAVMNESLIRKFSSGPLSDLFTCHGDSPEFCLSFAQHDSQLAQHESNGDRGERSLSLQEAFGQWTGRLPGLYQWGDPGTAARKATQTVPSITRYNEQTKTLVIYNDIQSLGVIIVDLWLNLSYHRRNKPFEWPSESRTSFSDTPHWHPYVYI